MKVDFFIVGTQKGGTTALYSKLLQVDGIQMSVPKEIHFFDNEGIDWNQANYESLHACFDWSSENIIRGEATPIYCYWPESIDRIHAYNPAARIIMLLRHPAHRAYSQWRMEFERGDESLQFADAISEKGRLRVAQAVHGVHRVYSYVERGFYSEQIKRLRDLFPLEQCLFFKTEELWSVPQDAVGKVTRFLGVGSYERTSSKEYVAPLIHKNNQIPMQENLSTMLHQLTALYKEDIEKTERVTGLDLSDWLSPKYQEPIFRR